MKWVIIIFVAVIGYMIATGNMGGAKKATQNYADVMTTGKPTPQAKPAAIHGYIEHKNK
jgi:hypothetical protein